MAQSPEGPADGDGQPTAGAHAGSFHDDGLACNDTFRRGLTISEQLRTHDSKVRHHAASPHQLPTLTCQPGLPREATNSCPAPSEPTYNDCTLPVEWTQPFCLPISSEHKQWDQWYIRIFSDGTAFHTDVIFNADHTTTRHSTPCRTSFSTSMVKFFILEQLITHVHTPDILHDQHLCKYLYLFLYLDINLVIHIRFNNISCSILLFVKVFASVVILINYSINEVLNKIQRHSIKFYSVLH